MDTVYKLENSLRRVNPYYFKFLTQFKPRWASLTVKHVLCKELGQEESVVDQGINSGNIYVTKNNGRAGGPTTLKYDEVRSHCLQPHDIIYNHQHMHEPTVYWKLRRPIGEGIYQGNIYKARTTTGGICIIYEDENLLVVNKPGGVPTHPSGIYRLNTMTEIVKHELGFEVWPCHRLDKATLGILILAKNKDACKNIMQLIEHKSRSTQKLYIARVKGNFNGTGTCYYRCPVFTLNSASHGYVNVPNASQVPTSSLTEFWIWKHLPESNESIVMCRPISGKMHQIRVHLRNLGHPIMNDPIYNPDTEVNKMKNEIEIEIYKKIFKDYPSLGDASRNYEETVVPRTIDVTAYILDDIRKKIEDMAKIRKKSTKPGTSTTCGECGRMAYEEKPDWGIFLEAIKMEHHSSDTSFEFMTGYPIWSLPMLLE